MVKCNHFSWRRAMSQHKFLRCVSFLTDRGVGQRWCVFLLIGLLLISPSAFAADLSLEDLIAKIQSNQSKVTTPMGKMEIEMEYKNVKVNTGIGDGEFKI